MRVRDLSLGILSAAFVAIAPAAAEPRPWKASDKPPEVAGIKLGDSEQHALDVLGAPDEVTPNADSEVLQYVAKGLEVAATKKDGVVAIHLLKPDAGSVDGIKVGDIARNVLLKWGAPSGGRDRTAEFITSRWTISVRLSNKEPTIIDLTLAYNSAKPPTDSSKVNVFRTQ